MSMTDRDKKIIFAIVPLLLLGAYWFFLLAPKRDEASKASEQLSQAEGRRANADAQVKQLNGAKASFADDYASVIRMGKAVPASVDMPSLLVQLDRSARGTGIKFQNIKMGQRTAAPGAAPAPAAAQPPSSKPAQPGAPAAQSGPGRAGQAAGGAVQASNNSSAQAGASAGNQQAPAAPGAAGTTPASSGAPGLESIPLEFTFKGDFFDLADFFHRMKRFVRAANQKIVVRGRLITVDSFSFKSGTTFPKLTAEVKATVYLAPKAEGVSAGATPGGPAPAAPGSPPQSASSSPTPPAATAVTP
jgi:hypothetical protein